MQLKTICISRFPHLFPFRAELDVRKMSLHPPITMERSSTYSALTATGLPTSGVQAGAGPLVVPVIPFRRTSKWNSTLYKQQNPFTVTFDTEGMTAGCGVNCQEFALRSAAVMATVVVRGGEQVDFPEPRKKVQLRIVWPGYENVDFSPMIDVRAITVSQLAGKVASVYRDFFQVASKQQCTLEGWNLSPELLENLRILKIRNVYDNVYQAEVIVG